LLGPDADAPVEILKSEHAQIERWLERMTAPTSRAELADVFASVESLLRGHIEREDDVLFPMAERILGDNELSALDRDFVGAHA